MEDSKDPDQTLRDINKALDGLDKELREKKRQTKPGDKPGILRQITRE